MKVSLRPDSNVIYERVTTALFPHPVTVMNFDPETRLLQVGTLNDEGDVTQAWWVTLEQICPMKVVREHYGKG